MKTTVEFSYGTGKSEFENEVRYSFVSRRPECTFSFEFGGILDEHVQPVLDAIENYIEWHTKEEEPRGTMREFLKAAFPNR